VPRVPTGVKGLDEMLGGGLPQGRCVLVCGGPGSGKTIFGIQYLYTGVTRYGETGLYITLDESPTHLKQNLAGFNWNIERLEKDGKLMIVDASPIRGIPGEIKIGEFSIGKRDFTVYSLWAIIKAKAQEIDAKRVVVDPISTLIFQFPSVSERQKALLDLFKTISDIRVTSLVMTELRATSITRRIRAEEFLSDGVIVFHNFANNGRIISAVQIEKMRGIRHDKQLRPYEINENGIEVFPKESIFMITETI
jgi:KaiC/GvpD/RAD55 family RecA-like ATPase